MIKKGKRNKIERDRLATLENLFKKFFKKRHRDEASAELEKVMEERNEVFWGKKHVK